METTADCPPVEVSRRIEAPAERVFAVLTDPRGHVAMDGSGMVRGAVTIESITAVGQVFVMSMRSRKWGDYEIDNHVVGFEPGAFLAWEPAAGRGHPHRGKPRLGHRWAYRLTPDGATATVVTEIYDCSRAPALERAEMSNGKLWIPGMEQTLTRLTHLVTDS